MELVDGQGVPLGVHPSAATPAESSLALQALDARATKRLPDRIIADRGHGARHLWEAMKARGIDLIAPHLRTRTNRFQDGRKLEVFRAFIQPACAVIALRRS